jgi:nucleotide-binding universal stress UspA family protein
MVKRDFGTRRRGIIEIGIATEANPMYTHLLVATDGSKLSGKAVTHAIALAQALSAKLTAFYASPDYPLPAFSDGVVYDPVSRKDYARMAAEEAQRILGSVKAKANTGGVACDTLHTIASAPWEAILAAARKSKCDAIVMASHGRRGLAAMLLGSETQKVLTHSKLPVLVVR